MAAPSVATPRHHGHDAYLLSPPSTPRLTPNPTQPTHLQVLHWDARIFYFHDLLSSEECDYVVRRALPALERSGVVETETGASKIDEIRTSDGMFFSRAEDPIIESE